MSKSLSKKKWQTKEICLKSICATSPSIFMNMNSIYPGYNLTLSVVGNGSFHKKNRNNKKNPTKIYNNGAY